MTAPRIADVVTALALATDLGIGQPMGHALRQSAIALRLADRLEIDPSDRDVLHQVGPLAWLGCTADSHELAKWFGDDIAFRGDSYGTDLVGWPMIRYLVGRIGGGGSPAHRARIAAALLAGGFKQVEASMRTHCELTAQFAADLGLTEDVQEALRQIFERVDGKGTPRGLCRDEIALPVRVVQLADIVEVAHRLGGLDAAVGVARGRRGSQFDPDVADVFCDHAAAIFDEAEATASWDVLAAGAAGLGAELTDDRFDGALEAVADFVDLKSPYTSGHSRGVASLAEMAAQDMGLPDSEVTMLRRAGLVHDIGRVGIPNTIWDKPGPLSEAEMERVRLHSYLTERVLARSPAFTELASVAASHHERNDGTGYHRGLSAEALPVAARILAAADTYHAMLEPRPHREAYSPDAAGAELQAEVRLGRLDGSAVHAVLRAAGHRVRGRPGRPAGLTAREVEVLALLARGFANREIASRLHISGKTVGRHVENIYTKIDVSSRAGAALFATRHGLLGFTHTGR